MSLTLTSAAFQEGGTIPREFTCEGEDLSPPFSWSGAPAGTKSFVLVCDDPDAPGGTFHHWAAFNIPADWTGLRQGYGANGRHADIQQAINDFRARGYRGPCPPRGHKPHAYHFRLSALSGTIDGVHADFDCVEIQKRALPMEIETVELIGYYRR